MFSCSVRTSTAPATLSTSMALSRRQSTLSSRGRNMLGSKSAASAGIGGGGSPVFPARAAAAPPLGSGRRPGPGGGGLRSGRPGRCYGSAPGGHLERSVRRPARGQRAPRVLTNLCGSCILFSGGAKIFLAATCRPQASHSPGLLGAA